MPRCSSARVRATPAAVVPWPAPYAPTSLASVSAMKLSLSRFIVRRMPGRGGETADADRARAGGRDARREAAALARRRRPSAPRAARWAAARAGCSRRPPARCRRSSGWSRAPTAARRTRGSRRATPAPIRRASNRCSSAISGPWISGRRARGRAGPDPSGRSRAPTGSASRRSAWRGPGPGALQVDRPVSVVPATEGVARRPSRRGGEAEAPGPSAAARRRS